MGLKIPLRCECLGTESTDVRSFARMSANVHLRDYDNQLSILVDGMATVPGGFLHTQSSCDRTCTRASAQFARAPAIFIFIKMFRYVRRFRLPEFSTNLSYVQFEVVLESECLGAELTTEDLLSMGLLMRVKSGRR